MTMHSISKLFFFKHLVHIRIASSTLLGLGQTLVFDMISKSFDTHTGFKVFAIRERARVKFDLGTVLCVMSLHVTSLENLLTKLTLDFNTIELVQDNSLDFLQSHSDLRV